MDLFNQLIDGIADSGYYVLDEFLTKHTYHALQAELNTQYQQGNFLQARVGNIREAAHHPTIRGDRIAWIDAQDIQPATKTYISLIQALMLRLNAAFYLSLKTYELHYAVYPPGSFYKKHVDQFHQTRDRKISCVYYLNDNWQAAHAGELVLYGKSEQILTTVAPIGNRLICFNSTLPHEVLKTHALRYSVTGWLKS